MRSCGVHHVDLVVSSIERSLPFYRDLLGPLGWHGVSEVEGDRGETIWYLWGPGSSIGLREAQTEGRYDRYRVGLHHLAEGDRLIQRRQRLLHRGRVGGRCVGVLSGLRFHLCSCALFPPPISTKAFTQRSNAGTRDLLLRRVVFKRVSFLPQIPHSSRTEFENLAKSLDGGVGASIAYPLSTRYQPPLAPVRVQR